ncbi:dyp-type peroxidase family protein [Burkholderia mallei NCTC 10247]|nr:dyp-type peroxidase family protein [Burkholderia mallei NCTC 10247]
MLPIRDERRAASRFVVLVVLVVLVGAGRSGLTSRSARGAAPRARRHRVGGRAPRWAEANATRRSRGACTRAVARTCAPGAARPKGPLRHGARTRLPNRLPKPARADVMGQSDVPCRTEHCIEETMSDFQPGILAPIPAASRYLSFRISHPEHAASVLAALRDALDGVDTVIGLGPSLVQALDRKIDGLKEFPELSVPGAPVPSTPAALWVWLRADDLGAATVRSRDIERLVAPAFELDAAANAFRYADDRDLSGYEDGTENPEGDEALEVAFVSGKGAGLDGASFVAVQQWVHDFGKMREIPGDEMDRVIGRRKDDNEELEDAPAYAHVKRTEQESFKPEAKVLRRSSPWADERRAGLYFVAFGHSFRAFEVQMRRMIGATDGVHDGLFRFTQPITGSFFWCPPVKGGKLDLSALGL